ncbi:MAG: restriction endonuclease subunit S [Aureispira sp.]
MDTTKHTLLPYEEYVDTGDTRIKQIPQHWKTERGKWLFIKQERPIRTKDEIITCFRDGQVTLRKNRRTGGFTNALKEHGYQGIRKGDLVINQMDAFAGSIGVSDSEGKSTPVYSVCTERIKNTINNYFYAYYLRNLAHTGFIESLAKGIRERSTDFRFKDFSNLLLVYPPLKEQTKIAHFLDEKCAQIDRAIQQKEQLIQLLQERQQIIVQHAVTRGLDPHVPMQDSGVDWIGEIPKHWEVKRLKYVGILQNGISAGAEYFGAGFPFVSYSNVYNNISLPKNVKGLAKSSKDDRIKFSVKEGDLFFTRTSETVDEIGYCSTCFETIKDATFAGFLIRFRPTPNIIYKGFSKFYFSCRIHRAFFVKETNLVIRASLSQELLNRLPILIPPIKEQEEIANFLDDVDSKFNLLIRHQKNLVKQLKEYKQILINEVVTGKVRVL